METKLLEVRDRMTLMPVLAIKSGGEPLLRRAGFSTPPDHVVILVDLTQPRVAWDAFDWPGITAGRTLHEAHKILETRWSSFADGDVLDVEFELGETSIKKDPEVRRR